MGTFPKVRTPPFWKNKLESLEDAQAGYTSKNTVWNITVGDGGDLIGDGGDLLGDGGDLLGHGGDLHNHHNRDDHVFAPVCCFSPCGRERLLSSSRVVSVKQPSPEGNF